MPGANHLLLLLLPLLLLCMDTTIKDALRALISIHVRRYIDLESPKAWQRRLKARHTLVLVLLGYPNIMCVTNTKGEIWLSGRSCTTLSALLRGHVALKAQQCEALSMQPMACNMHFSQCALLRVPRGYTQWDFRTVRQRVAPSFPQPNIVKSTTGRNRAATRVPLPSTVKFALCMAQIVENPPPLAVLRLLYVSWMQLPFGRHPPPVQMCMCHYIGGTKYASNVNLCSSWFCMDGGMSKHF